MDNINIKKRIDYLAKELLRHQFLYYVKATPEISDLEYDRFFDELLKLEEKFPQYIKQNSPSKRIGSDLDNSFPEKNHSTAVLSLDKEYRIDDVLKWARKINKAVGRDLSFTVEEKVDGASIVLYYRTGLLDYALTRGNGITGNDVTENIRTINQIPLMIKYNSDLAVRGEIFIKKSDFANFNKQFNNKYANPRNLASGSLRNIKSSVTAIVPLNMICYQGYFTDGSLTNPIQTLDKLKNLGFRIRKKFGLFSDNTSELNKRSKIFSSITTGSLTDMTDYINQKNKNRDKLDYEIDGLVIKVNDLGIREYLGNTAHHPRWAMAFKFDSPTAETIILDIEIGVGRNGRITPVAILNPVQIAGSTISRATLHNQEYIDMLELSKKDVVSISKRGDIIPAVDEVLEKNQDNFPIYKISEVCPFCSGELTKDGSHQFCKNEKCPERIKRSLSFFVAKDQMDIDTLGEKTISFLFDKGFIKTIPDIYTFDYDLLLQEEGFKEKKIRNIRQSLRKSKQQPFHRVLTALGFDGLGTKAVSELIKNGFDSIEKIISAASQNKPEIFSEIEGFGQITAEQIIKHFNDPDNLQILKELKTAGLIFSAEKTGPQATKFKHQVWVITGSFQNFIPRSKAKELIINLGGRVSGSVSAKTTHILVGTAPGSKLKTAKSLGTRIVNEEEFLELTKK